MRNPTQTRFGITRLSTLTGIVIILAGLLTSTAFTQTKKPISKEGLTKAIQLNGLSTSEIVQQIQMRGVEFEVTPEIEAELRAAGARPEVIEATRASYRPRVVETPAFNNPTPRRAAGGPPLSENEIVTSLQNGASATRLLQSVRARGVDFKMDQQNARRIKAAGATPALLSGIGTAYAAPPPPPPPPAPKLPDYDELTDQATSVIPTLDADRASRLLKQAISLDSTRPTAYTLLGTVELYLNKDIVSAEQAMRAAIERNGSARFRVLHDHTGNSFNEFADSCVGSIFVTKTNVTFKADNGVHTFETDGTNIKKIGTNGWFGVQYGAFHIEVKRDGLTGKSKNYNFAPALRHKAEAQLVVNLVRSYQQITK